MPFELQIAIRYLLAKRKQALISAISLISIVGVSVGVMAVVIALAMMTGLHQEVRDRILDANAHVYVWTGQAPEDIPKEVERLRQIPHVVAAAPAILGVGLLRASGASQHMQIKGVDPALERAVTDINRGISKGSIDQLVAGPDGIEGMLLGRDLAARVGAKVGDIVDVLTLAGVGVPGGRAFVPRRLRVAGIFSIGLLEFDSTFGIVSLDTARRILGAETEELIQLRVDDFYDAPAIKKAILAQNPAEHLVTDVQDWTDMNQSLFRALGLEKIAISLAIGLIVMVAALNIVGTLILLVMEKHRDIAILKTMGTTSRSVTLIFMLQGLVIGVVGTTAGATIGYAICRIVDRYRLITIPQDVYQVSYLPFKVLPLDFMLVVVSAILICFVATIYPSRQAAKLDPAQALRYE